MHKEVPKTFTFWNKLKHWILEVFSSVLSSTWNGWEQHPQEDYLIIYNNELSQQLNPTVGPKMGVSLGLCNAEEYFSKSQTTLLAKNEKCFKLCRRPKTTMILKNNGNCPNRLKLWNQNLNSIYTESNVPIGRESIYRCTQTGEHASEQVTLPNL